MNRFFAFLISVCLALPVAAQSYPDYEDLFVNDFANIIPTRQEERLRQMLRDLRDTSAIEFTIVTINRMSDYGHQGPIEPFATGLFNHWGVGNAERNDGVMMLISRFDRSMRIELGSGYGTARNTPMKRIIDRRITPEFRNDRYGDGIEDGARAVIAELTGQWPGGDTASRKIRNLFDRVTSTVDAMIYPILGALGVFGIWMKRRIQRYRPRRCPEDGTKMELLAEHWDDQYLEPGQVKEEELKSVDYDVWQCPSCEHRKIEAYSAWLSRYGACRECHYKTLEGVTHVISHATSTSTGLKRIDYTCHFCAAAYSVEKVIPKVSSSSNSSRGSSSSRSFGGGRSSGGGASGRW